MLGDAPDPPSVNMACMRPGMARSSVGSSGSAPSSSGPLESSDVSTSRVPSFESPALGALAALASSIAALAASLCDDPASTSSASSGGETQAAIAADATTPQKTTDRNRRVTRCVIVVFSRGSRSSSSCAGALKESLLSSPRGALRRNVAKNRPRRVSLVQDKAQPSRPRGGHVRTNGLSFPSQPRALSGGPPHPPRTRSRDPHVTRSPDPSANQRKREPLAYGGAVERATAFLAIIRGISRRGERRSEIQS